MADKVWKKGGALSRHFFAILEELQGGCVQAHTPAGCRLIMYLAPDVHPMGIQSGFKLFNGFSTRN